MVAEGERQKTSRLGGKFTFLNRKRGTVEENLARAKAKKAKREARLAGGGASGRDLLRIGLGKKGKGKVRAVAACPSLAPSPPPRFAAA